ncbi:MAG: outer membrane lipoprotein-sorting protein [Acidobacteriota bacterium]
MRSLTSVDLPRARSIAALALLIIVLPTWRMTAEPPAPGADTAQALIETYNARKIGDPGKRCIRLRLYDGETLTRDFRIAHLWQRFDAEIRSLVLLQRPDGLHGTSYLLIEDLQLDAGMRVFLQLASSKVPLEILPGRFDEGLLGSDFGYRDLLWRLPMGGHELLLDDASPRVVISRATTEGARAATAWSSTRSRFRDDGLLETVGYFVDGGTAPAKRLEIEGWTDADGAWTPRRMTMQVDADRRSLLTLDAARFGVEPWPAGLFEASALPEIVAFLRQHNGALPPELDLDCRQLAAD